MIKALILGMLVGIQVGLPIGAWFPDRSLVPIWVAAWVLVVVIMQGLSLYPKVFEARNKQS